jgi:hypothetical protein
MNHSNFNFYDAFDFDDDTHVFAFQVVIVVVAEEESNNQGRRTGYRGSILGHNIVNCNRKEGELRLYNDYFAENSKFTESQFRRRFRMSRRLFLRITNTVEAHKSIFQTKNRCSWCSWFILPSKGNRSSQNTCIWYSCRSY